MLPHGDKVAAHLSITCVFKALIKGCKNDFLEALETCTYI